MYRALAKIMGRDSSFTIIYGSQTGTAESLAENIADKCVQKGYKPELLCADQAGKKFNLEKESCVVIVMSSTGDGDPPDNALKFVRNICNKKSLKTNALINLRFALLALGDSNYSTFHGCPKKLLKGLLDLGARPFYETGWADDATSLETVVEPWIEGLFPALSKHLSINSPVHTDDDKEDSVPDDDPTPVLQMLNLECGDWPTNRSCLKWSKGELAEETHLKVPLVPEAWLSAKFNEKVAVINDETSIAWQNGLALVGAAHTVPVSVPIVDIRNITKKDKNIKTKMQITLNFENIDLHHEPGDSYYFIFPNPEEEVNTLLERLHLDTVSEQVCNLSVIDGCRKVRAVVPAFIPNQCSLRYILTNCIDIRRTPGRPFLRTLAEYCSDEADRRRLMELSSVQGMHDFTHYVRQAALSLIDVLMAFPSCIPPIQRIIEHCPRLQPRPYSVVDSLLYTKHIRFAFTLVEQKKEEGRVGDRLGLCTGWMAQLKNKQNINVLLKEPSSFRLPADNPLTTPLILVGPGTGVAPFIAFLKHIRFFAKANENENVQAERWLFYGCRNMDMDYIYRDEIEELRKDKVLTDLVLCESQPPDSRKGSKPVYVQTGIIEHGKRICDLLSTSQSRIYICGDASSMSKAVCSAFQQIFVQHAGMSDKEAVVHIKTLRDEKRYIEDVWS